MTSSANSRPGLAVSLTIASASLTSGSSQVATVTVVKTVEAPRALLFSIGRELIIRDASGNVVPGLVEPKRGHGPDFVTFLGTGTGTGTVRFVVPGPGTYTVQYQDPKKSVITPPIKFVSVAHAGP